MAGDWIKVEHTLPDKPEIVLMATVLKMSDQDAIAGKVIRLWIWADQNSIDGESLPITEAFVDRMVNRKGFSAAMRQVGWLTGSDGSLTFPNFERHNGTTAKGRANTNRRVSMHRNCNAQTVTDVALQPLQKPLPEKRREEKSIEDTTPPPLCTIEQARSAASMNRMTEEEADHWWHTRNASGWTKGSTAGGAARKITSWQSDMATSQSWVKESLAKQKQSPAPQASQFKLEWEQ